MRAFPLSFISFVALAASFAAGAQVPVDDAGNPIGSDARAADDARLSSDAAGLTNRELELLVDRVALYPDDLLAIVLPAASYPLQVVEASRFLDALVDDPAREPDADWDDSIVALINYPEIVELMNEDLEWTYALGEAFVMQQEDLLTAVDSFRDRAYAAGNLKTDDYQEVRETDDGIIEIEPVNDDVIYVPYYEPERVVVYQTRPVYHYYSRAYPVYYYPYAASWVHTGYFYGLTSAFQIGWSSHSVHVLHHSQRYHPYYGRYYRNNWWYRRPSIHVHNSIYVGSYGRRHARYGDYWRPRHNQRIRLDGHRVTRSRHYGDRQRESIRVRQSASSANTRRDVSRRYANNADTSRRSPSRTAESRQRYTDRGLPAERRSSGNRENSSSDRVARSDRPQRTPGVASDRSRGEQRSQRRPITSNPRQETPASRRQDIMNPDRRVSEQRQNVQQRSIQRRPQVQSRPVQVRPAQSRPTQSRPTQSRPTQSRPTQSRQVQSRPTQSRPVQSRPTQSRPSRPEKSRSAAAAQRTVSRPAQRRSEPRSAQRSRPARQDAPSRRRPD